ncbi:hypothetical protein FHS76_003484 [Ochrobactrum daejeonense]|uniref:Uncharacterized protein n=1 Tax=Brucella daejeonensis TaxID=659015 RepID=A0A7W9AZP5_9HYPH|nr:phage regulatory CII family protein [Brucella daejeonensis]MBB5703577.1 hypothetical protein [Brucella daejeonensis]
MNQLTDAWFYRIKAAQNELIKYCGGIEQVTKLISLSKSQVGRWNNPLDPDMMPVHIVCQLEAQCGVPSVTSVMAALNNRRLAEPDDDALRAAGNLLTAHSEVVRSVGEVMSIGAQVFADGKVTGTEAMQLDKPAADAERRLGELRRELSGHIANARRGDPALRVIGDD